MPLRQAFADLTVALIQFVRRAIDKPKPYMMAGADPKPKEVDLQDHLHDWLQWGPGLTGNARIEVPQVAAGRVDVEYTQDNEVLTIECKRELVDASREALQDHYGGQGASYTASRHNIGIVAVMDLARKLESPVPVYRNCIWVHRQAPEQGDRTLLYIVVPGNLVAPSSLSK